MQRRHCLFLLSLALPLHAVAGAGFARRAREPVLIPCEGCDAIFDGVPSTLSAHSRIAPPDEPGEPLTLTGTVRDRAGRAQPDIVVYAYHTDNDGQYPRDPRLSGDAARHGRLRAWVRTDAAGRYRFDTIRPGTYPDRSMPQHIHMHVLVAGRGTYYIGDLLFDDDPLLTAALRAEQRHAPGGSGVVTLRGDASNGWQAERDIVLGANIPGAG